MLQVLLLRFCCCNDFLFVSGIPSATYCLPTSGRFFSPLELCCAWGLMDVTLLIAANTCAPLEERDPGGVGGWEAPCWKGWGGDFSLDPPYTKEGFSGAVGCFFEFFAGS